MMYSLTVFSSIFDNKTNVRVDFDSFEKFERALYDLSKRPGYKTKRGERGKKSSPLISPAVYKKDTTRANKNVIEWASWAALDIDNHECHGDIQSELYSLYSEWYFICYSTASSTVEKPKFRLVFPLTEAVPADKIKHFWYALNKKFGQMADDQTKDLSRMYYVPAQYPNAYNFFFTNQTGKYVNPAELMTEYPWQAPKDNGSFIDRLPEQLQREVVLHRQAKLAQSKRDYEWTSYRDCPFVNQRLIEQYRQMAHMDGSGRYSMIFKIMASIACSAVKHKYPIAEWEIVDMVRQLDRETSNRYAKRPLNTEASRAIEFAYKNV